MNMIEGGWPSDAAFESTLPGEKYYDGETFRKELEKIWFKTWLCAGREEEIPNTGNYTTVQIAHENFIVTRGSDGQINAFYNVCRHRGSRLCTAESGHFSRGNIICPYHSWMYSGDSGQLKKAPNIPEEDEHFDKSEHSLVKIKAEAWDGYIWINVDPNAPPLEESFNLPESWAIYERYQMDRLKLGKKKTYTVKANWKLLMENAEECYHCGNIYPELSRTTPPSQPRNWVGEDVPETTVLKHVGAMALKSGFERVNIDGNAYRPVFPGLNEDENNKIAYLHIFPHSYICMASDYVFIAAMFPIKPDETLVKGYWLFDPEILEQEDPPIDDAVDFWHVTSQEDWEASELVQLGNQSKAYENGGVLTPIDWRVANFKKYVQSELERPD
ncbi:aromatic ring-hydroxylating oxygenase subunit alpha [Salibacterium halotolerans]|uniref:Rieske 2Fe-2S family protein n=1 Tax=Salibacterium halotolerans TaxID=1884432 RepID=A0A1I5M054_9BACI|nr:aromatic ring-hydroxylating dioxygenase subunit alpha [Salibacterium halotolerans]SFP02902.1 Rieske 2Fe-2S family protein [Salibacterium halotolerans]